MRICPTCGTKNEDSLQNCSVCGTSLVSVPVAPISRPHSGVPSSPSGSASVASTSIGKSHSLALTRGTRLHGEQYSIGEVLGQGGFGITYRGGDMQLRRYVAIKEFFPFGALRHGTTVVAPNGVTADEFGQSRRAFVSEAQVLAKFSHPGIVRVFGAFEENNSAYMVMELLEGRTLGDKLQQGPLPQDEALDIIQQVGEALQIVHEAGLLHRDIKPDNILLVGKNTSSPRAVLIDFGTAREFTSQKTRMMTAQLTPGYAPLEQYGQQARFGPYTDVYALAGTLYHALTRQLPTSATDRLSGVDLKSPHELKPSISPAVSHAVMHGLSVKAPERPQSVRSFLDELQFAIAPPAVPPHIASQSVSVASAVTGPPTSSGTSWPVNSTTSTGWPAPPPPKTSTHTPAPPPPKPPSNFPIPSRPADSDIIAWGLGPVVFICLALLIGSAVQNAVTPSPPAYTPPDSNWAPTTFPTFTWATPLPVPTTPPVTFTPRGSSSNDISIGQISNAEVFREASDGVYDSVFNYSPNVSMDTYQAATSSAGRSANDSYWATGGFTYYGDPTSFSFGSGTVSLNGRADAKGYSRGSWRMEMTYSPLTKRLEMTTLEMSSLSN